MGERGSPPWWRKRKSSLGEDEEVFLRNPVENVDECVRDEIVSQSSSLF